MNALLFVLVGLTSTAQADTHSITGAVKDAKGAAVAGATVTVEPAGDEARTASSAEDGTFSIGVAAGDDRLMFSFAGHKTCFVQLNGRLAGNVVVDLAKGGGNNAKPCQAKWD